MDPYSKAKDELSRIDSEIAALQQRRAVLRQFVDMGEALFGKSEAVGGVRFGTPHVKVLPAKTRILSFVEEHIRERGPTHTRDLVAAATDAGVEITGSDKVSALSVILSKSTRFDSDRKLGWSLAKPKEQTPQGALTPAGSE
jgi:hypothetical protein